MFAGNHVLGLYPEATRQSSGFSFCFIEKQALAMLGFVHAGAH
jgi:hypothetical protein